MRSKRRDRIIALIFALIFSIPFSVVAALLVDVSFLSVFVINIISFYLLIDNLKSLKANKYRAIYLIVNVIKLILLFYNAKNKDLILAGTDWLNFDHLAQSAMSAGSLADIYSNSQDLFVFFMAIIYKIFGPSVDQIFFYIYPLSLILFKYVMKAVGYISKRPNVAAIAGILVIAWPVNMIFSVSLLREMPIQVAVVLSFYCFVRYLDNKRTRTAIWALIWSVVAMLMHSGMIILLVAYVYILLQKRFFKRIKLIRISTLAFVGVMVFAVSLTPLWSGVAKHFADIGSVSDLTQTLEQKQDALVANTNYINSTPQNAAELLMSIPYRVVMFSFSPFPWQVYSFNTLFALIIDGLPQIILVFLFFRVIRSSKKMDIRDRNIIVLAASVVLMTYLVFSFGTNNYGTAMRHRAKVLPIVVVVAAAYLPAIRDQRRRLKMELKND